jgi:hypothetical protein
MSQGKLATDRLVHDTGLFDISVLQVLWLLQIQSATTTNFQNIV